MDASILLDAAGAHGPSRGPVHGSWQSAVQRILLRGERACELYLPLEIAPLRGAPERGVRIPPSSLVRFVLSRFRVEGRLQQLEEHPLFPQLLESSFVPSLFSIFVRVLEFVRKLFVRARSLCPSDEEIPEQYDYFEEQDGKPLIGEELAPMHQIPVVPIRTSPSLSVPENPPKTGGTPKRNQSVLEVEVPTPVPKRASLQGSPSVVRAPAEKGKPGKGNRASKASSRASFKGAGGPGKGKGIIPASE